MHYQTTYHSTIGELTLACHNNSIIGLWIKNQKYYPNSLAENSILKDELPLFYDVKNWLDSYFSGQNPNILNLPLAPVGSDFSKEVWRIIKKIPYGETLSYGEIAKEISLKNNNKNVSAQAVGGAVGRNPISIIIPCHRVLGSNGSLSGYAGGIEKKIKLLQIEKVNVNKFFIPKKGTAL